MVFAHLKNIIDIIGNKKIVFITHLNINNIHNRVIIKESIEYATRHFNSNNNIYMIDPITVINKKNLLEDELHFNIEGINEYKNYLKKIRDLIHEYTEKPIVICLSGRALRNNLKI